ncbi:MAG: 50S ribosomal protein L22 [Candidatus Gracilibacteria bacterium]|jgi:large subunit ribosomal protein L22
MIAHLRKIRISSKKVNLVAGMVRRKPVQEALDLLKYTTKVGARPLYKTIQSAASNAKNNFKQDLETLVIKEIIVTEGMTYKRSMPASRGRAHPIKKRTCHITVKVEADPNLIKTAPKAEKKEKPVKKSKSSK